MNILFLASYYPNKFTGEGSFMRQHALALGLANKVTVLGVKDFSDKKLGPFHIEENLNGEIRECVVYYNTFVPSYLPFKSAIRLSRFIRACLGFIRKQESKFDKVLLNVIKPMAFIALYLKYKGYNYSILEHSTGFITDEYSKLGTFEKFLTKATFRHSQKLFVVSAFLGEGILNYKLFNRFTVIPNVIDNKHFKPFEKDLKETIQFLHISNFAPWKNVETILFALSRLIDEGYKVKLCIIGEGANKSELMKLTSSLNLDDNVSFKGFIPHSRLPEFIVESDVLVMNSEHETFCCVLYECIACGIPALAPKKGAIPENFKPEFGLLHACENELLSNMKTIILTKDNYNSNLMNKKIGDQFSLEAVAKCFQDNFLN